MKLLKLLFSLLLLGAACSTGKNVNQEDENNKPQKVIIAYVTSWSNVIPDTDYITHINYAFGHVNDSFDGIRIDNEERLCQLVKLRENSPDLKILLSIGGWGSGRFSEMAADENNRQRFAADCLRIVNEYKLDGIDLDWEYPTSSSAGISSSPGDTDNFTLLVKEIRKTIGENKLLTMASAANAEYVDFKAINESMDFVNIMTYDMGTPPYHHSALYDSGHARGRTASGSVSKHIAAGIPAGKLVLGMPFYGRGGKSVPGFIDYKKIIELEGYKKNWDEDAKVPYLTDEEGDIVCVYDNPESLKIKCRYIIEQDLLGGMYWDYAGDNEEGDLRKTLYESLRK